MRSNGSSHGRSGKSWRFDKGRKSTNSPGRQQRVNVVLERDVGDARLGGVGDRAAQFLLGHDLVGDGLHHVGAGDEHVELNPSP